jgi:hypothetical protein
MVCFRYIIVNTLHKGDKVDDNDAAADDDNNNNKAPYATPRYDYIWGRLTSTYS